MVERKIGCKKLYKWICKPCSLVKTPCAKLAFLHFASCDFWTFIYIVQWLQFVRFEVNEVMKI